MQGRPIAPAAHKPQAPNTLRGGPARRGLQALRSGPARPAREWREFLQGPRLKNSAPDDRDFLLRAAIEERLRWHLDRTNQICWPKVRIFWEVFWAPACPTYQHQSYFLCEGTQC